MKNFEFEYRGMSKLIALSGISGPSGFHCMEETRNASRVHIES